MKKNKLQKKRTIVQIISSILFILILAGGWFYPLLGYFAIACMAGAIGIAFFRGRKWCDFCPRGSFWDIYIKPISRNKKIHSFFTNWYTRVFVILLLMTIFAVQIIKRWPDFYSIGFFFIIFLTVTTAVGLILGILIHPRTWCRFCPIGSMANIIGRRKYPLKINSKKCTDCGICFKVCPMQLNPSSHKKSSILIVNEPDCIKCGLCVSSCPNGALTFS